MSDRRFTMGINRIIADGRRKGVCIHSGPIWVARSCLHDNGSAQMHADSVTRRISRPLKRTNLRTLRRKSLIGLRILAPE